MFYSIISIIIKLINKIKNNPSHSVLKEQIEEEIDKFLKAFPFHNLFFLYEVPINASKFGGTCTDRTQLFKEQIKKNSWYKAINVLYHRAMINDKETHTILKVIINEKSYFLDVGMGFPINRLIPSYENIEFNAYGIKFQTQIIDGLIVVQSDFNNKMEELMKIPIIDQRTQAEIKELMNERFTSKSNYPFSKGLRYMFIHKNIFYSIKHDSSIFEQKKLKKYIRKYYEK